MFDFLRKLEFPFIINIARATQTKKAIFITQEPGIH